VSVNGYTYPDRADWQEAASSHGQVDYRESTIKPQPEQNQAPVVQRIRIRYAKRGPLRFTSHRDFARAFERAVRRAGVPIAFSQGFSPHPKISYASAAPTGVASEAEYLEIGLQAVVDPDQVVCALDAALSPGLDVLEAVQAPRGPSLVDRIDVSRWRIELPAVEPCRLAEAVESFMAAPEVLVERLTKQGWRRFDARAAVVSISSGAIGAANTPVRPDETPGATGAPPCAILDLVVRQATPQEARHVRPDDVLAGLRVVADLEPPVPPRVIRLAQGRLTAQGEIVDPLGADDEPLNGGRRIGEPSE
jgi:radical SAM-linked protein